MRKSLMAAVAFVAMGAVASPVMAQEGWNAGLGYTHFDGEDVQVGGVTGRLGYRFHPNFGVEGEATFGTNSDEISGIDVELDNAYGVYGVGYLPMSENLDLFGRVGYAQVEASASALGTTVGFEEDGIGFGGGVQWRMNNGLGLRAEYTRLEGEEDGVDTFGLGVHTQF